MWYPSPNSCVCLTEIGNRLERYAFPCPPRTKAKQTVPPSSALWGRLFSKYSYRRISFIQRSLIWSLLSDPAIIYPCICVTHQDKRPPEEGQLQHSLACLDSWFLIVSSLLPFPLFYCQLSHFKIHFNKHFFGVFFDETYSPITSPLYSWKSRSALCNCSSARTLGESLTTPLKLCISDFEHHPF